MKHFVYAKDEKGLSREEIAKALEASLDCLLYTSRCV